MPTRCKNGTRRYPAKTGTCIPTGEIPKKTKVTKKTKSVAKSTFKNIRCKNGTRRHPPKTGFCIKKELIGKKKRVHTPILSYHSNHTPILSSQSSNPHSLINRLIVKWEIDNGLGMGEIDDIDKNKIRNIVINNEDKSFDELYDLITDELSDNYNSF